MEKIILKIIHLFDKIFLKQGLQLDALYAIVENKLLMDKRRVVNAFGNKKSKNNDNKKVFTYIGYIFFGLMIGLLFFIENNILSISLIFHTYIIFMMCMTLITDFAQVILDTTDNQIILPKPINSKTLSFARLLHIFIYLLKYTLVLSIFPWVFCFINYGALVGIGLMLTSILSVLFALGFTYLIYTSLIHLVSLEKLNRIISGFQIVLTILFVVLSQLLPRLIGSDTFNFTPQAFKYYHLAIPSYWTSYFLDALDNLNFEWYHFVMIFLAFCMPVFLLWFINKKLAPSFANKLSGSETNSTKLKTANQNNDNKTANPLSTKLAGIVGANNTEAASFDFTWKLISREKLFKMQFYPSIAYIFVFIVIFGAKSFKHINTFFADIAVTNSFLMFIYMPIMAITTGYTLLKISNNYEASWVYYALPIEKPSSIMLGAFKALLLKFFVPIYIFLFGASLFIWGPKIIDDFIFGLLCNIFVFQFYILTSEYVLPFSMKPNVIQEGGKFIKAMLGLLLIGAVVGLHYLLIYFKLPIWVGIIVIAILIFLLHKKIETISWAKVKNSL